MIHPLQAECVRFLPQITNAEERAERITVIATAALASLASSLIFPWPISLPLNLFFLSIGLHAYFSPPVAHIARIATPILPPPPPPIFVAPIQPAPIFITEEPSIFIRPAPPPLAFRQTVSSPHVQTESRAAVGHRDSWTSPPQTVRPMDAMVDSRPRARVGSR